MKIVALNVIPPATPSSKRGKAKANTSNNLHLIKTKG